MKTTKYLGLITCLYITFELVSDITAGKLIDIIGQPVAITVLYFPFTYIFSDIITEVYGYAKARAVLWIVMFCTVLATCIYMLVVAIPPSAFFNNNEAYSIVLGQVPMIVIGAWVAVFSGDIANNYVMSKLKVRMQGKYLWFRAIASTVIGQFVNTVAFYIIALSTIMPASQMLWAIIYAWIFKTVVEVIMSPITIIVINWLKKKENLDVYDTSESYNPFKFELPF